MPYRHDSKRTVVTGFAMSFSPPKSVSLVGAFGDAETAAQVKAAHDSAVRAALGFLEDHAAFSRTGRGGFVQVDTEGFVAAAFTHHTSRAGDPQLHSHVLVANKVLCGDGRWRSLDGREQFAFQKAAGMLYNATLRVELSARLGVAWEPVDGNGQADIAGVPKDLIELFSKRRHHVERRAAQRIASLEARLGRTLTSDERAEQYQRATYNTRPAKTHEDDTTLDGRWRTEAHVAGWDPDRWLSETLARDTLSIDRCQEVADPATVSEVVAELAEARSTWSRAELAKAVARRLPPGLGTGAENGREWIEATTAAVLTDPEVVSLCAPLSAEVPAGLRRRDGLPGHERHGAPRHTLARKGKVLDALVRGRLAAVAIVPTGTVERAARAHGLGVDQTAALRRICEGGERLVCVVGPAGAGKTRMIRAARDAWAADGTVVRGLAVSAVAAGVLAEQAGVPADTVAKFLHNTRRSGNPSGGLGSGEIVVVDEAAMLGSADLAALVEVVEAADAKLVLLGDHRQLGAVEAGGLFPLLVAESRAAELHQVRRFSDPWEADATLRLRNGDESVLDDYAHGRIAGGTREDMVDQAFTHWRSARTAGQSIVVMAADHATVDALALRARAERVAAGEVEPDGLAFGAQLVGQGDEIITTRNDRRLVTIGGLWVRNGDRWHIDERRDDGALVLSHLDGWGRVVLPTAYATEHVALAYAVTPQSRRRHRRPRCAPRRQRHHRRAPLRRHEPRPSRQPGLCRHRRHRHQPRPPATATPVEVLTAAMGRSSAERSATETLRDELERGEDRETRRRLDEHAVAHIERCAGPDRRPELRRLQQLEATLPMKRKILALNQRDGARLDQRIATTRRSLSESQEDLDTLTRRRRFRRPNQPAIDDAHRRVAAHQRELESLQREQARVTADLERNRGALRDTERTVSRIPEVQAAIQHRREWFLAHPAELAWEADLADLAGRLADTAKTADPARPRAVAGAAPQRPRRPPRNARPPHHRPVPRPAPHRLRTPPRRHRPPPARPQPRQPPPAPRTRHRRPRPRPQPLNPSRQALDPCGPWSRTVPRSRAHDQPASLAAVQNFSTSKSRALRRSSVFAGNVTGGPRRRS